MVEVNKEDKEKQKTMEEKNKKNTKTGIFNNLWVTSMISVLGGISLFIILEVYDYGRLLTLLYLKAIEDYLPFIFPFLISLIFTKKIKLSFLVGLVAFILTWVIVMIIIGWGIAGLMH